MANNKENSLSGKSFDQIVVKDGDGRKKMDFDRPMGGDLTLKNEGGRTVIERTGFWGQATTYLPSSEDSIEAKEI